MDIFKEVDQEHRNRVAELLQRRNKSKSAASAALEELCVAGLEDANKGTEAVYGRQWEIERRLTVLRGHHAKFEALSGQWAEMYGEFNDALKEVGEIDAWAKGIGQELEEIIAIVASVENAQK